MAKARTASANELLSSMIPVDNPTDPVNAGYNEVYPAYAQSSTEDDDLIQDADIAVELGDRELGSHIVHCATCLLMEDMNIPDKIIVNPDLDVVQTELNDVTDADSTGSSPRETQTDPESTDNNSSSRTSTGSRRDTTLETAIRVLNENLDSLLASLSCDDDDLYAYMHLNPQTPICDIAPLVYLTQVNIFTELCFRVEDTRLNLEVLEYLVCYKHNVKDIDYKGFKDAFTKYTKALHSGTQAKIDKAKTRLEIYMSLKSL